MPTFAVSSVRRKDKIMATKETKMFILDPQDLDVEELEARLELAALFATGSNGTSNEQVVAIDWGNCSSSGPYVC
jgi:hypothetical protein